MRCAKHCTHVEHHTHKHHVHHRKAVLEHLKAPFGIHSVLDVLVLTDIGLKALSEHHVGLVVSAIGGVWVVVRVVLVVYDYVDTAL